MAANKDAAVRNNITVYPENRPNVSVVVVGQ